MKQSRTKIILIFLFLAIGLVLYYIFKDGDKRYQWYESYRAGSSQPYGTSFIQKMLETYRSGNTFILNDNKPLKRLLDDVKDPGKTDYVFIGQNIFLDEESTIALANFMDQGGDVFIASLTPPEDIIGAVYFKDCDVGIEYESNQAASVDLNFFHDRLRIQKDPRYAFRHQAEDHPYSWSYVNDSLFCDSTKSIVPLGYQRDRGVNFMKIAVGSGNLYLHTNPIVFTNYFLTQPEKVDYASVIFSHLDGRDIIWDEYSKILFTGDNNAYNSPLYYILQQPSLKYAWWLLLLTVALYIFFAARRKQRVIPVLESKTNTSLEFVNLISRLHYKNGSHVDMARKKMRYFLYFVRSKYGIHAETFRNEQIHRLAEKSKVKVVDVEVIFRQYYLIEDKFRDNIEANRLAELYYAIDEFYKQCK
jgi:hypothetical protein